jgi:hypothetical protein
MRVLAINGSARGEKGVTQRLLAALGEGLIAGGAELQTIQAGKLKIAPCVACLSCMLKTPGVCAQTGKDGDEMAQVYEGLKRADLLVLASPVYTDGHSAQLKAVIDRCICAMRPFLEPDGQGRLRHPLWWSPPRDFLLLSTCGFPEPETFAPLIATFRAQAANFGARALGEICLPGSLALQMRPESLQGHLELLRQAGRELAGAGEIPAPLLVGLNQPPLGREAYLEICREYEEACRRRLEKARG